MEAVRADGTLFPAEMTISEFPEGGHTITALILRDISERRAAEAEVRRLNADLNHRLSAGVDLVAHLAASLDPSEVLARLLVRVSAAVLAPMLPTSLTGAVGALAEDQFFRSAFGDVLVDYLVQMKRAELARYEAAIAASPPPDGQDVSDWEMREYFEFY